MDNFNIQRTIDQIWIYIAGDDKYIANEKPYLKIKEDPDGARDDIIMLVCSLWHISVYLEPFMPKTAEKIQNTIKKNKIPEPLFKRAE